MYSIAQHLDMADVRSETKPSGGCTVVEGLKRLAAVELVGSILRTSDG